MGQKKEQDVEEKDEKNGISNKKNNKFCLHMHLSFLHFTDSVV